jgi:Bacterial pre-peptidase C-terminal domain
MFAKTTLTLAFCTLVGASALAQQVTLPLPRLLTLMPMGGQAGTQVEVTLTGENTEDVSELLFSSPKITAKPVAGAQNKFTVSIAADAPVGVYDARVISRLGVSSARAFSVGKLPEVTRAKANNTVETAMALPLGTICNATMTKRAVDFYSFKGVKGKRVAVDCAAIGIDSRLTPILILADAKGGDLKVNRTGGVIDFTPPADGTYVIKVSDLTYQGGDRFFYRLALQEVAGNGPAPRQPQTQTVSAMSWPRLRRCMKPSRTTKRLKRRRSRCPVILRARSFRQRMWTPMSSAPRRARSGGWRWPLSDWG